MSMSRFVARLFSKTSRVWFSFKYSSIFRMLGQGAFLNRPFRIDGADRIELGSRTVFQSGSWLYCSGGDDLSPSLRIGEGCVFGYNNHIAAVREVQIGDQVLTANNVYISDNVHSYEDVSRPIMHQPVLFKRAVVIGDGCWIGENACIIGARVGNNCVVGANAVVTSDIPNYSVAVGVPAVVIKQYDPQLQVWVSKSRSL
ncbi:MAG: acyltransferase [Nitrospiraceae bacterium]|nr:acyltransferase [Nitrospiraceae bacterium]